MLINRFFAALIMIGGFLISKAIFRAHPFNIQQLKEKENKAIVITL